MGGVYPTTQKFLGKDNAGTDSPILLFKKKIVWGLDPASDSVEITNIVDADDESTYKSIDDF